MAAQGRRSEDVDLVWKSISRFDHYYSSTHNKAAAAATLYTFVLGAVVLKWPELKPSAGIATSCLWVLLISTSLSLFLALLAILPYFGSSGTSLFFFGDVARLDGPGDYSSRLADSKPEEIQQDLEGQAYFLAKGLRKKYRLLGAAIILTLFTQVPAVFFFAVTTAATGKVAQENARQDLTSAPRVDSHTSPSRSRPAPQPEIRAAESVEHVRRPTDR